MPKTISTSVDGRYHVIKWYDGKKKIGEDRIAGLGDARLKLEKLIKQGYRITKTSDKGEVTNDAFMIRMGLKKNTKKATKQVEAEHKSRVYKQFKSRKNDIQSPSLYYLSPYRPKNTNEVPIPIRT